MGYFGVHKSYVIYTYTNRFHYHYNDIYLMAFALKGKVLEIIKEKVITCGRGHVRNAVSRALRHELVNKCKHACARYLRSHIA